jgi:hypothetical protein
MWLLSICGENIVRWRDFASIIILRLGHGPLATPRVDVNAMWFLDFNRGGFHTQVITTTLATMLWVDVWCMSRSVNTKPRCFESALERGRNPSYNEPNVFHLLHFIVRLVDLTTLSVSRS